LLPTQPNSRSIGFNLSGIGKVYLLGDELGSSCLVFAAQKNQSISGSFNMDARPLHQTAAVFKCLEGKDEL